ncbi:hypothetical protein Z043_123217 [Scleropages formosus]|uniref:GDNF/GAS1 domain-containing protein n=1 Tax=Scleropages formosus TaxID=113540 RepID=A0A0P7TXS3_SCLFO|nr:hypothetical protein Z043_123217 [Scleropages formosus]
MSKPPFLKKKKILLDLEEEFKSPRKGTATAKASSSSAAALRVVGSTSEVVAKGIKGNVGSGFANGEEVARSLAVASALSGTGTPGWRTPVDCVKASDMCNQSPQCSSRFRIMRQCLVGRDRSTMLANRECQAALEVLQDSPLYDCRCKRGMKRELQCLQSYWSIHMGLTEGARPRNSPKS